jgi:mRNA-degrading endonuclease YafQ of YafQ-DinJ toxin-antitoxin module
LSISTIWHVADRGAPPGRKTTRLGPKGDSEALRKVEGHRRLVRAARAASDQGIPLRLIKGFHDEALEGKWKGFRSSRLSDQWRVIYRLFAEELLFQVASITAHDYRRQ